MYIITRVYKMGNKLGISLKKTIQEKLGFQKGEYISVKVSKIKSVEFVTRFNYNIILRKSVISSLKLKPNDKIKITLRRVKNLKRPKVVLKNNQIDILSLIPEKTFLGHEIFVTSFTKSNREWLRVWYSHERSSGRQVELVRYVDIPTMGKLLGQLQAEGTKLSGRKWLIEFSNNLLNEHEDFIKSITKLGINPKNIELRCTFNPTIFNYNKVKTEIENFCVKFGIENFKIKPKNNTSTWKSFKTLIRRTALTEILLFSMNRIEN